LDPTPVLLPPAQLADALHAGELDVALVPLAECLLHPEYDLVDGIAIAARHPVYSVILTSEKPHATWQTLSLDPASRTSTLLTRVIVEHFWGQSLRYVPAAEPADARLIIGDPARDFRRTHPSVPVIDLAEEWKRYTSLPFVFAVWAVRRRCSRRGLANYLREIAGRGLAARRQLAQNEEEFIYLTEHISYEVGLEEKKAIHQFAHLLTGLNILQNAPDLTWI
jgi:chorismate dehydratase